MNKKIFLNLKISTNLRASKKKNYQTDMQVMNLLLKII